MIQLPGGVQQGARLGMGQFGRAELRMPEPAMGEGRMGKHRSSRDDQRVTWEVEAQTRKRSLQQCLGRRSRWQHLSEPGRDPLLLGIRDGEPTSCSKWGRLRYLLPGERLEVASQCQAWATTELKLSAVIRAEWEPGVADSGRSGARRQQHRPALPCLGAVQEPQKPACSMRK